MDELFGNINGRDHLEGRGKSDENINYSASYRNRIDSVNWILLVQNRVQFWTFVNVAVILKEFHKIRQIS
jgi:hypothetical protein